MNHTIKVVLGNNAGSMAELITYDTMLTQNFKMMKKTL